MTRLLHYNIDEVQPGYTVFYDGIPGYAELREDTIYVNGKTLMQLLDSYNYVCFIK